MGNSHNHLPSKFQEESMLKLLISRCSEQEPAFQVKLLCFETGIETRQIFKQFSQNVCTLPLEAS